MLGGGEGSEAGSRLPTNHDTTTREKSKDGTILLTATQAQVAVSPEILLPAADEDCAGELSTPTVKVCEGQSSAAVVVADGLAQSATNSAGETAIVEARSGVPAAQERQHPTSAGSPSSCPPPVPLLDSNQANLHPSSDADGIIGSTTVNPTPSPKPCGSLSHVSACATPHTPPDDLHHQQLGFPGFPEFVEPAVDDESRLVGCDPSSTLPLSTHPQLLTPACIDRPCAPSPKSQPTHSPILQCSIRPQPFLKSPVRTPTPSTSPPRSPKSTQTRVDLDAEPLMITPSIANRIHPPPGETVRSILVKKSVKTLLRTLPKEQRAVFISNNNKVRHLFFSQSINFGYGASICLDF